MLKKQLIDQLDIGFRFFKNTIEIFTKEDSAFAPAEGVYTTAQQIAHTAQTVDWFIEGAFLKDQFDMNFEQHDKKVRSINSIQAAKDWLKKSFDNAKSVISSKNDEELQAPLPEGPILSGVPRAAIIGSILDHTAHHRGSLAVYARLVGKTPKMPYG